MKKLLVIVLISGSIGAFAQPMGEEIVKRVNERFEGEQLTQQVTITMVDKRGKKQERSLMWFRKDFSDQRKSIIFYKSPANVKGTSFLTYDYNIREQDDDQWLYLPALRKTRRISASNRGDYFLGTDLTYEDVKLATKIGADDYQFSVKDEKSEDGISYYVVEGLPNEAKVAKELGYGKVQYWIDQDLMIPRKIYYWDMAGNKLKLLEFKDIKKVHDIWTTHLIEAENYKTKHKTTFHFEAPDYQSPLEDELFQEDAMIRGI